MKDLVTIVPISGIHPGVVKALKYACSISHDVRVVYIDIDKTQTEKIEKSWATFGLGVKLNIVHSPFRSVLFPLLNYIDTVKGEVQSDMITVVIPEFVTKKWYHQFLHNQMTFVLRTMLRLKPGIVVTSVRYHL